MSRVTESDERVLIAAAQNDPGRFAELYELNFHRVYAYIARRIHDRSETQDLTAHVFQQALANIGKFKSRGAPFITWLYRIAANAIADHARKKSRETTETEVTTDTSVDSDLEQVERCAQLFRAVESLPEDQRKGKPEVICGQGPAPAGATIAHYKSEGLDMVPGTGLLAACVPGMFDTWMLLLRDYGTMRLADVLTPAISYAQNGHPLVERANATIRTVEKLFRDHWPTSAAVYLPDGKPAETGKLFTNKTLAATYARVLKEAESAGGDRVAQIEKARKVWSQGFVAEAIDKFCRTQDVMDVSGTPHKGVLTGDDMAKWQAARRGAAHLRLRPLHRLQGAVEPGPGDAAAARAAQGLQSRRPRRGRAGLHPSRGRVLEARLRRPREVLRRSGLRRRAVRDAAVGRLQRRAPQARHRQGVAGAAARLGRRLRRGGEAEDRRQARRRHGRRRADRRPHGRGGRRHRALRHRRPGRQHGDARRRRAAGCNPRR